jgi:hypothetical protein
VRRKDGAAKGAPATRRAAAPRADAARR